MALSCQTQYAVSEEYVIIQQGLMPDTLWHPGCRVTLPI